MPADAVLLQTSDLRKRSAVKSCALGHLEIAARQQPDLVIPLARRLYLDALRADLPEFIAWAQRVVDGGEGHAKRDVNGHGNDVGVRKARAPEFLQVTRACVIRVACDSASRCCHRPLGGAQPIILTAQNPAASRGPACSASLVPQASQQ